MAKKVKFNNTYIYIENRDGIYLPYTDKVSYSLGMVSPGLLERVSQVELSKAYETGFLKSLTNNKGE